MFILNAFSLNMLAEFPANIQAKEIGVDKAAALAVNAASAVGHADTARVFENTLGVPVACNRTTVTLRRGDKALVGQYSGPRLPEGATELPEGATIKWLAVSIT